MNIFHKVTVESLKKNKTRTIVTIIGIILSSAMICAVTTFTGSFQKYMLDMAVYENGGWHGAATDTDYRAYEKINASGKVEGSIYMQQLGYARMEGCKNEDKPYLYLLGGSEGAEEMLSVHMISGKYPDSPGEIILPGHLASNGGIKYNIGDKITLELGDRMSDGCKLTQNNPFYRDEDETFNGKESRAYEVVGFFERLSFRIEDYSAPGYTAITAADETPSETYRYDVYLKMKKPKDVYAFMDGLDVSGTRTFNSDVLMYSGVSKYRSFDRVLYSLAAVVIALIMVGSVSLIYNAFSISVSERTKQFGLLSSVGATRKQLRRMVMSEALTVSAVGIPIGVLAGIGGIGVTLMLIGDKFRFVAGFPVDIKLRVSPPLILAAAVVALVTVLISAWIPSKRAMKVTAIEAIRQNLDVNTKGKQVRTSGLVYKLFGLPGMLADKYYKRSRKKYRTTIFSLFISIVLFVSASAFTDYLTDSFQGAFDQTGYDIEMWISDLGGSFEDTTQEELLEQIKKIKFVTDAAYLDDYGADAKVEEGGSEEASKGNINLYIDFVDDLSFKALLKEHRLNEQNYMDSENPLAIAVDGNIAFNFETERYETVRYLKSDDCEFTAAVWDSETSAEKNYTLRSGKTIDDAPYFVGQTDGLVLLYPMSLANAVIPEREAGERHAGFRIRSDDHTQSYAALQSLLADNGLSADFIDDVAAYEEGNRSMVLIVRVFSYGFIVLISLIAAANVFNTISTNISLRRRDFAMLKSVGMASKGFNKMMNFECMLYGSKALLYGLPVSFIVTCLIWKSIHFGYETKLRLPWTAVGIAALSVFAVVFATMMYSMSKIKKDNPIDALRNENL